MVHLDIPLGLIQRGFSLLLYRWYRDLLRPYSVLRRRRYVLAGISGYPDGGLRIYLLFSGRVDLQSACLTPRFLGYICHLQPGRQEDAVQIESSLVQSIVLLTMSMGPEWLWQWMGGRCHTEGKETHIDGYVEGGEAMRQDIFDNLVLDCKHGMCYYDAAERDMALVGHNGRPRRRTNASIRGSNQFMFRMFSNGAVGEKDSVD
eukprot:6790440-Ditylum_brightwellii.AAC.1